MVGLQVGVGVEAEEGLCMVSHHYHYYGQVVFLPPAPPGIGGGGGGGGGGGAGMSPSMCRVIVWRLLLCTYSWAKMRNGERMEQEKANRWFCPRGEAVQRSWCGGCW